MTNQPPLVKDLGEHGLLAKLQQFCPQALVGDDGVILPTNPEQSLVVTTDILVEEVHFSDRTTSAFDAGWRAVAANLSDLAAMGASPLAITVGLAIPGTKTVAWIEELYQGMKACLDIYHVPIAGGDISRSQVTTLAITAFGEVLPARAILRSNAQPGYALVATGLHGLSRGGLALLLEPSQGQNLSLSAKARLIQAHQRPIPRLDVLPLLAQIPTQVAIAGMDSSDGLADAVRQICHCSGVGARLNRENIGVFSGLTEIVEAPTAWSWLLSGGEDFELVLALPKKFAVTLVANLGREAAIIGEVTQTCEIKLVDGQDNNFSQDLNLAQGFQHFSTDSA